MEPIIDQLGRHIVMEHPPKRIVSLVPSQTELLYDLGLDDEVVGITTFCVHPNEWFENKKRVGGTKKVNYKTLEKLEPDLIIGNKEENSQAQISKMMEKYTVWMSDVNSMHDATEMIKLLGKLTGRVEKAASIIDKIIMEFAALQKNKLPLRTAYLIWSSPYMVAANDTFVDSMLRRMGLLNCFSDRTRYPEVSAAELERMHPELILLSSEPFPFKEDHVKQMKEQFPEAKVMLVDGQMFSWYGSRLMNTPKYMAEIIYKLK